MEVLIPCENCISCKGDFQKVVELPYSGLVIYVYAKKHDQKTTVFGRYDESIILHNTNSKDLVKPDYITELCQYRTKCNQCNTLIQRIRSLLDQVVVIKGNQVIAICDCCKNAIATKRCRKCDFMVSKFQAGNEMKIEKRQKRFKAWLLKVKILLQTILNAQSVCKHEVYEDNELERILKEFKVPLSIRIPDIELFPNIHEDQFINQNIKESKDMLEQLLSRIQSEGLEKCQTSYESPKSSLIKYRGPCICKLLKEGQVLEGVLSGLPTTKTGASLFVSDTHKNKNKESNLGTLSENVQEGFIQKTLSTNIPEQSKQVTKTTQDMVEKSQAVLEKTKQYPVRSPSKLFKDGHKDGEKAFRKDKFASGIIKSEKDFPQNMPLEKPQDAHKGTGQVLNQTVVDEDKTRLGMVKTPGILNKARIKEPHQNEARHKKYVKEAAKKIQDGKSYEMEAQMSKDAKEFTTSIAKKSQIVHETSAKREKVARQAKRVKDIIRETDGRVFMVAKGDKTLKAAKGENTAGDAEVTENAKEAKVKKYANGAKVDNNRKQANGLKEENDEKEANGEKNAKEAKVAEGEKEKNEITNKNEVKERNDASQAKPGKDAKEEEVAGKLTKNYNVEKENLAPRRKTRTQSIEKFISQSTSRIKLKSNAMPTESDVELQNLMKEKRKMREKMHRKKSEIKSKDIETRKLRALANLAALPEIKFTTAVAPSCNTSHNISEAEIGSYISQYIVKGNFIEHYVPRHKQEHDSGSQPPVFFKKEFGLGGFEESGILAEAKTDEAVGRVGIIKYRLSDKEFIDKGWTKLPTKKIMRRMNIYKMEPAYPQYDWFERHKDQKTLFYDTGEKLADIDVDGRGVWYYKNGNLALEYYNAEEMHAGQRYIVYSCSEEFEFGRPKPRTVLGLFDFLGNGVVYDSSGNVRLKYNQSEGIIIDPKIGPPSRWKWHTLNEPPVLQQVFVNARLSEIDPHIVKLDPKRTEEEDVRTKQAQADMLQVELDNFVKEKSQKLMQKFKPFQIRMKAAKLNKNFSIKILDQSNIYLLFRNGQTSLKLNLGMNLISHEIVDTDISEAADVSTPYDKYPAKTGSVTNIQNLLNNIKKLSKTTQPKQPMNVDERISKILY